VDDPRLEPIDETENGCDVARVDRGGQTETHAVATRTADSTSGTRITDSTGPKISFCAILTSALMPSKIAGATKKPRSQPPSVTRVPPRTSRAPPRRPTSTQPSTLSAARLPVFRGCLLANIDAVCGPRNDRPAPQGTRREHSVVQHQVDPRPWRQHGQPFQQLQRIEAQMRRAIRPAVP
jgi:hypothetical protein